MPQFNLGELSSYEAVKQPMMMELIPQKGNEERLAEVAPADRLSDHVYHYDQADRVFELADKTAARKLEQKLAKKTEQREPAEKKKEAMEHARNEVLEKALLDAKPKAAYYDAFVNPEDCTNVRTSAKQILVPERHFVRFLIGNGYLYRAPSGKLMPYAAQGNVQVLGLQKE